MVKRQRGKYKKILAFMTSLLMVTSLGSSTDATYAATTNTDDFNNMNFKPMWGMNYYGNGDSLTYAYSGFYHSGSLFGTNNTANQNTSTVSNAAAVPNTSSEVASMAVVANIGQTNTTANTNSSNTSGTASTTAAATAKTNASASIPAGAIVVAKDGSGAYTTVQAAINSLGSQSSSPKTIYIKDGTYTEVVTIPGGVSNLTLLGASQNAVIQYNNYNGKSNGTGGTYGTGGSASVFIKGSNITVKSVTIKNSFVEKGNNNEQAVALSATGNKIQFYDCNIMGNQDTLLCDGGTQYFNKCMISGDVDFIFGQSQAFFENCEIRALNRKSSNNNGYLTAARTSIKETYGFVFANCNLTCETGTAGNSVWLGRPWCPSGTSVNKAAVAYINCSMGSHIKKEGWTSMSGVDPSHGRFYEYNCTGSGAVKNSSRPQLSASQAQNYTKPNVLKGWNPSF